MEASHSPPVAELNGTGCTALIGWKACTLDRACLHAYSVMILCTCTWACVGGGGGVCVSGCLQCYDSVYVCLGVCVGVCVCVVGGWVGGGILVDARLQVYRSVTVCVVVLGFWRSGQYFNHFNVVHVLNCWWVCVTVFVCVFVLWLRGGGGGGGVASRVPCTWIIWDLVTMRRMKEIEELFFIVLCTSLLIRGGEPWMREGVNLGQVNDRVRWKKMKFMNIELVFVIC